MGSLRDITPERAMLSWSASIVGIGVTVTQDVIYTDRVQNAIHRLRRDGTDQVIYNAPANRAEVAGVEIGPDGELYFADAHGRQVMELEKGWARVYLGSTIKSAPIRFGVNASPEKRGE
jgi:hypothetical protein